MDKNALWKFVKEELESAVNIGLQSGYDTEEGSEDKGRYDAYRYILDAMNELDKESVK